MFLPNSIEEKALELCERRSVLLAANIAHGSTPHYKAKDINFHETLNKQKLQSGLMVNNAGHIKSPQGSATPKEYYRVPAQVSLDGNTVDEEFERKNFMQNAIRYQASLAFIQSKSYALLKAIKGE